MGKFVASRRKARTRDEWTQPSSPYFAVEQVKSEMHEKITDQYMGAMKKIENSIRDLEDQETVLSEKSAEKEQALRLVLEELAVQKHEESRAKKERKRRAELVADPERLRTSEGAEAHVAPWWYAAGAD